MVFTSVPTFFDSINRIILTLSLRCKLFYPFDDTPGPLTRWSAEQTGLSPIHSINCRANVPVSHSLDKMSSVWARPTPSITCRANGPRRANGSERITTPLLRCPPIKHDKIPQTKGFSKINWNLAHFFDLPVFHSLCLLLKLSTLWRSWVGIKLLNRSSISVVYCS